MEGLRAIHYKKNVKTMAPSTIRTHCIYVLLKSSRGQSIKCNWNVLRISLHLCLKSRILRTNAKFIEKEIGNISFPSFLMGTSCFKFRYFAVVVYQ